MEWILVRTEQEWKTHLASWDRFGQSKSIPTPKEFPVLLKITYNTDANRTELIFHLVTLDDAVILLEASGIIKVRPDKKVKKKAE